MRFVNLIGNMVGKEQEELTLSEGATFRDLLDMLVAEYGKDFHDLMLTEGGQLRQLAHLLVNGQDVRELGGIDASIGGIPQLSIAISVPPIAGG